MKYNKLVRDKIPEIIRNNGDKCNTRMLDDSEYIDALNNKLLEEAREFIDSQDIEELADLEEVILSILEFKNSSREELDEIRKNKVLKRGSFKKRVFLIDTN